MLDVQSKSMSDLELFLEEWLQHLSFENCGQTDASVAETLHQWLANLNVNNMKLKQVDKDDLPKTISTLDMGGSELWQMLKPLPEQWVKTMETDTVDQLHKKIDFYMLQIYQQVFDPLVEQFGASETTRFFTVQSMVVSAFVFASYLIENESFYKPLVDLYRCGHSIVGISGDILYFT